MKSSRLSFFLVCWIAAGGTIFCAHLLNDEGKRRDLTGGIAQAVVWGALIAAIPSAIQGSLRKGKNKDKNSDV